MPARKSKVLTEAELELMEIIWEQGEATAYSVRKAQSATRASARSTVRTMLRVLENTQHNMIRCRLILMMKIVWPLFLTSIIKTGLFSTRKGKSLYLPAAQKSDRG